MVLDAFRGGVCGRALEAGVASLRCVNPRDFAAGPHRSVDDRPYGGGPGMVLSAEPLLAAVRIARAEAPGGAPVIFLTPQGGRFTQRRRAGTGGRARHGPRRGALRGDRRTRGGTGSRRRTVAGRFRSERRRTGRLRAVIDAVVRLLPGALGDDRSAEEDSFSVGLLDFPQYTRPAVVEGRAAPEVLLSGDHEQVRTWRLKQSLGRTWARRPELLSGRAT